VAGEEQEQTHVVQPRHVLERELDRRHVELAEGAVEDGLEEQEDQRLVP
jgi:hypothetical protein